MRIWLRELFATLLLLAGLGCAAMTFLYFKDGWIIEGTATVVLAGVLLFVGGYLMKVALAVSMLLRERTAEKEEADS